MMIRHNIILNKNYRIKQNIKTSDDTYVIH